MANTVQWKFANSYGNDVMVDFSVDRDSEAGANLLAVLQSITDGTFKALGPPPAPAPFDLARAIAGEPIEREDGTPMLLVAHNPKGKRGEELIVRKDKDESHAECYCEDGRPLYPHTKDERLRMRAESLDTKPKPYSVRDRWLDAQELENRVVVLSQGVFSPCMAVRILDKHPKSSKTYGVFRVEGRGEFLYRRADGDAGESGKLYLNP